MAATRRLAPSGRWEMPNEALTQALGQFIMAWSLVESTIEVAICKQLGLAPLESSIITAGLMFKARATILQSLLKRSPRKNAKAIEIIQEIQDVDDRNDILHSIIGGSKNTIWFNRRKTQRKFSSKIEFYDRERLLLACLKCSDLAGQLQQALEITNEDYLTFFQESHNAANSS
jgi:hypothetical protein